VAIVAAYKTFGLSDADIAHVLGSTSDNVRAVVESVAYVQFMEAILQNVREHDNDKVRKLINDQAFAAAKRVVALKDSHDEKVALSASKDLLDRASGGAYSTDPNRNVGNHLTIRIIDDRNNPVNNIEVDIDA
jgi:hypothetical protein